MQCKKTTYVLFLPLVWPIKYKILFKKIYIIIDLKVSKSNIRNNHMTSESSDECIYSIVYSNQHSRSQMS
jgi:hypothetical protein